VCCGKRYRDSSPFDYAFKGHALFGLAQLQGSETVWVGTGEMRGSLHCATDGETVCCFGRDDASLGSWTQAKDKDKDKDKDKTKDKDGIRGSFTAFRMTAL
jgi:hypothetical protein